MLVIIGAHRRFLDRLGVTRPTHNDGWMLDRRDTRTYVRGVPYVGVGRRFLAVLVDWLLSLVWTNPFSEVVRTPGHVQYRLVNGRFLVVTLLWFGYYVVMETAVGATVGKLVTGIRVVRGDGSKPDLATSLKRTVLRVVDGFPFVLPYLVGAIAVWSSPTKQRLGDRWAGTYVVRAGARPVDPAAPVVPPPPMPPPPIPPS
jgi:uncharacterized RDD family membrane protein YckC